MRIGSSGSTPNPLPPNGELLSDNDNPFEKIIAYLDKKKKSPNPTLKFMCEVMDISDDSVRLRLIESAKKESNVSNKVAEALGGNYKILPEDESSLNELVTWMKANPKHAFAKGLKSIERIIEKRLNTD